MSSLRPCTFRDRPVYPQGGPSQMSHALSELHRWPGHRQVIMAHVPGGTRKAAQRKTAAQRTAAERRPLKYRRIADDLRESIRSGEYAPGGQLPGENELMQRYDVA